MKGSTSREGEKHGDFNQLTNLNYEYGSFIFNFKLCWNSWNLSNLL